MLLTRDIRLFGIFVSTEMNLVAERVGRVERFQLLSFLSFTAFWDKILQNVELNSVSRNK